MGSSPIVDKSVVAHSTSPAVGLALLDCVGTHLVGLLLLFL